MKRSFVAILFLCILSSTVVASEGTIDENIKRLKLKGSIRSRLWHYGYEGFNKKLQPGSTSGRATFQDLFFRNRLTLTILPELKVETLFDIGTLKFGDSSEGSAITNQTSSGQKNIRTRNLYFKLRASKKSTLKVGLMPIILPEGHVLANNGAGINYSHHFLSGRVRTYAIWIKAVENSTADIDGNGIAGNGYQDNDIFIVGGKAAIIPQYSVEFYYLHSRDLSRFDTASTTTFPYILNWGALLNHVKLEKLTIDVGLIANWGKIRALDDIGVAEDRQIIAGLWNVKVKRTFKSFSLSFISEGATGSTVNSDNANSFQELNPSHGLSSIVADNSGGIALRSGGRLYGLAGLGLALALPLPYKVNFKTKIMHYHTLHGYGGEGHSKTHLGDELNVKISRKVYERIKLVASYAVFLPDDAYNGVTQNGSRKAIQEVLIGARVNY